MNIEERTAHLMRTQNWTREQAETHLKGQGLIAAEPSTPPGPASEPEDTKPPQGAHAEQPPQGAHAKQPSRGRRRHAEGEDT